MTTELQIFNQNNIVAAFENKGGLDDLFSRMEKEAKSLVPDLTTDKGRKAIAAQAHKVSKAKVLVDDHGKDLVSAEKARLKLIDDDRKSWRDRCDALRDEIRAPLTAWEDAEKERVEKHRANIEGFKLISQTVGMSASELQFALNTAKAQVIGDEWEEFKAEAIVAKQAAVEVLEFALDAQTKLEAEQAELARLRQESIEREQAERDRKIAEDAANAARLEAEQKANAERQADAKREAEAIAAAESAKREAEQAKVNAEREQARLVAENEAAELRQKEALRQAESDRVAALAKAEQDQKDAIEVERKQVEAKRLEAEKAKQKRLADVEHVRGINQSLMGALMSLSLSEGQAKAVITKIAKNEIKHISIQY